MNIEREMPVEPLVLDFLSRGMPVKFEVTGGSMTPFIRAHDLVEVRPIAGARPKIGDVVVWIRAQERLVVHRVVAWKAEQIRTRGDATLSPDEWIPQSRVVGRVERIHRNGREIHLGLGPERRILGLLSRFGLPAQALRIARCLRRQNFSRAVGR